MDLSRTSPIFVAVGGIDGSGKTRLARALARRLTGLYRKQCVGVSFNRALATHPGFSFSIPARQPVSQWLCECYVEDFLKYAQRHGPERRPSLRPIVFDRWKTCVRAFVEVFGSRNSNLVSQLDEVRDPTVDIVLDVPVSTALRRIDNRGQRDSDEDPAVLSDLRDAYIKVAVETGAELIDGARSFPEVLSYVERCVITRLRSTTYVLQR